MKRLTVVLAAALIILAASGTAYAAPDESSAEKPSQSSSAASESSKASSESKDKTKNSSTELNSKDYATYNIKYFKVLDLSISLPQKDTYILTPEMDPNDPALKAVGKTSSELDESFMESDTIVKAIAQDLSYDITLTISHNEKTKEIGDLTTIDGKELQKISDNLLSSEYSKGISKNKYKDNVFLKIDLEYDSKSSSNTKIYGIQQYTVINGASVTVTMQSYNSKLTDQHKAIMEKVMNSLEFRGINRNGVSDVNNQSIGELNKRHLYLGLASLIAAAALAGIIIVGIKRRQTINAELAAKEAQSAGNFPSNAKVISDSRDEKPEETVKPEPEDLYSNSSQEKAEEKLTYTTELSIPKNPYTPVGKAEAIEQPAMSVTSEIAKFSIINAEAKRRADEEMRRDQEEEGIVFAQSTKPRTEIDQIGEAVFEEDTAGDMTSGADTQVVEDINSLTVAAVDALPESELTLTEDKTETRPVSAYERKFGKYRSTSFGADRWSEKKEEPEPEKTEEAPKKVSRFEQRFGKADPVSVSAENADSAEIKAAPVFEEAAEAPDTAAPAEPETTEEESVLHNSDNEKGFDVSTLFGELEPEEEPAPEFPADENTISSEANGEVIPEAAPAEEISSSEAYGEILPEEATEASGEEKDPFSMIVEEEDSNNTTGELIRADDKKSSEDTGNEEPAPKDLANEIEDYLPDETPLPEEAASAEDEPQKADKKAEEQPVIRKADTPAEPEKPAPAPADKTPAPAAEKPAPAEKTRKLSFFEKFKNKIFNAGEDDSIYITPEEIETHSPNEESTGKFLSTVKEKLRNKNVEAPEEETESISETPEVIINTSEKPEEVKPENTKEIYKAPPEDTGKIELAIQKNADGKIVINSVSDQTGKQLKIDVKDGDAQIKAKAEKARAMTEHLEPAETVSSTELYRADKSEKAVAETTEEAKPEEAATVAEEAKPEEAAPTAEEAKPEEPSRTGAAAAEQQPRKNKMGRKKKKKNKNSNTASAPQPDIIPETADGIAAAAADAVPVIVTGAAAAAGNAPETKPEAVAETVEEAKPEAAAETVKETKPEAAVETVEETKPEAVAETVEEDKPEAAAETVEETKTEAFAETAEETKPEAGAETVEEAKPEAVAETAEETKPEAVAETTEETKPEAVAETVEEAKPEAVAETAEETKPEAAAETTEETKPEAAAETTEETKTEAVAETVEETKPEAVVETVEEAKPEAVAETVEEAKPEAVAETVEEIKPEAAAETGNEILDNPIQTAFEAREEIIETAFNFERDSGIRFERADPSPTPVAGRTTIFTNIPRLESVNADEYNRTIEQLRRSSTVKAAAASGRQTQEMPPRASRPAQKPSAPKPPQRPQPPVKPPAKPPVKKKPEPKQESKIEFYSEEGEDDTLDPFAPNSQMGEIPLSELDKKEPAKFSEKLKRSFGKIFTKAEDED